MTAELNGLRKGTRLGQHVLVQYFNKFAVYFLCLAKFNKKITNLNFKKYNENYLLTVLV